MEKLEDHSLEKWDKIAKEHDRMAEAYLTTKLEPDHPVMKNEIKLTA